jgi:hypothetical protein
MNKKIIPGRMYKPGVIFSGYDKKVFNIYLILDKGLYNYVDGQRRGVP